MRLDAQGWAERQGAGGVLKMLALDRCETLQAPISEIMELPPKPL